MNLINTCRLRAATSILVMAVPGAFSLPAFAADPPCVDANGVAIVPATSTNQTPNKFGTDNSTCNGLASAFGQGNNASGLASSAFGFKNTASGLGSSAFGHLGNASGTRSATFGYRNTASGINSSAFGNSSVASSDNSSAFGYQSKALNTGSTAIGYQAVADRDYAVSVGATGAEHQIIHVADATQATDAVNLRQMQAGDAATLTSANAYTDSRITTLGADTLQLRNDMSDRFYVQDRKINSTSAMATAMTQMTANSVNGNSKNGRVAVGFGVTGGRTAISVGYGVRVGRGSISFGAAFSGGRGSAGAGFGLDL